MTGSSGGMTMVSDSITGKMVFEPILEGVFRFDCSADDRNAAFPSLSFLDPNVKDTPLMSSHKTPSYTPTFECFLKQQIVQERERNLEQAGEKEALLLEGEIGGGLVIERQISFPKDDANILEIN